MSKNPIVEVRRLDGLTPNPLNPRKVKPTDQGIPDLAASIRQQGILQPLLVTPAGRIVAGHRRAVAAHLADLVEVPVIVRDLDETEQLAAMLAENLQREDLNPLQAAQACGELRKRGMTIEAIAKSTGMGKGRVAKYLDVLQLPPELQEAVAGYDLTLAAVYHLMRLPRQDQRLSVGQRAAKQNWLATEVADAVDRMLGVRKPIAPPPPGGHFAAAAAAGMRRGTPVANATPAPKAPPASKTDARAQLMGLLCDATAIIRRHPQLIRDVTIRDWLESLRGAVNSAQKAVA